MACVPSIISNKNTKIKLRESFGTDDKLVRLSIGFEEADALMQDLDQALRTSREDEPYQIRDRPPKTIIPSVESATVISRPGWTLLMGLLAHRKAENRDTSIR